MASSFDPQKVVRNYESQGNWGENFSNFVVTTVSADGLALLGPGTYVLIWDQQLKS